MHDLDLLTFLLSWARLRSFVGAWKFCPASPYMKQVRPVIDTVERVGPSRDRIKSAVIDLLAFAALAIWVYLIAARGDFWLAFARDADARRQPHVWPP